MDIRSPLNQCIALSLAGILFLNPIVAAAAGLALDKAAGGNTGLGQAGNGVPIVNIATPNGAGLSNNHFRDYNVGANGLILNNATGKTQGTQLGGIILGNPNLKGQAAQVILNQVTGGNRSTLAGYTEVAGQSARVIVANPHGITCQGCGFINTPRATLTTGKPIMDGQRLERFQVDGGDIVVEGAELNVGNLEQFDLITRSAKLNAKLYAKNLNIVTGRNDVQADSLQATPRAADGSEKPQLAIDSSALGGMYAGAIRLVGVEKLEPKRFDLMYQINTRAVLVCSQAALPYLRRSANGHILSLSPPINLAGRWFAQHGPYTVTKYGMSMLTLGMHEEFGKYAISVNALWPKTMIATAAIEFELGSHDAFRRARTPAIMADAAHAILTSEGRSLSGRLLVDEELLRERGQSDFEQYRYDPEGGALVPDLFLD
ncbi:SDR family NAD(P)-dependent oxidoreductase [Pseudomonas aeruginosa]|nr:SDR family NAD(P)-dependent oxidoreductase [Pseudomonas aeruginosa]MBF3100043.1 SDR family NAD(P)-dependent oxidoreductase [Pseudomonas aeruginosa]